MSSNELRRDQLAIIIEMAPKLRAAGVLELKLGDLSLVLGAPEAAPAEDTKNAEEAPKNLLDDKQTYGLDPDDPDAKVPGFVRPPDL